MPTQILRRCGALLGIAVLSAVLAAPLARAADTDIVITEIMQNPAVLLDSVGEWFEIHNTGPDPVDLEGWTLKDDGVDSHVIASGGPLIVPAGGYAVLGADAAIMALEGVTLLYDYGSFLLSNSDDEIVLLNTSLVEVERVNYDGGATWPDPTGASMMWDEASGDNNVGANWATSTVPFGSGDLGTPGQPNGGVPLLPPVVANVFHRPLLPNPGETVTVQADCTDNDGDIFAVTLYVQLNGGGFTTLPMFQTTGDTFTGTIAAGVLNDAVDYYVEAMDSDGLTATNPSTAPTAFYSYTVLDEVITPIATIHADSLGFDGALVTVQGQVYVPGDYKADGVSVSAYIQDASGRGLNIYGTTRSTGMDLLNDTGNIVKVSGRVDWYGAVVEVVNYEVVLISGGNTPLTPTVLTTGGAAALSNEGTYIGTTGPITAITTTAGDNPAHNFTVNDGSGDVVIRIDDDVVVGLDTWLVGDELVAAGAGGSYLGAGQILVGLVGDVVNNGQGPDLIAPTLLTANLSAPTEVTLQFDEAIDPVTGDVATNYEVYETGNEANAVAVSAAAVQADPTYVVLTLAADASGVDRTVRVNNVSDLAGNPIAAATTLPITAPGPVAQIVITEIMQNPYVLTDLGGEWFEVYNAGSESIDMNGWTIQDLGTNLHVIDNGGPLVIAPGEYQVFAANADTMATQGVTVFYQYASMALGNSDDELILLDGEGREVDNVAWDGGTVWPDPSGASMQWMGFGDNNDGATWAANGPVFGDGDLGTPGAVNDWLSPADLPGAPTALSRNYPNPFNPVTLFSFALDQDDHVRLRVFDLRGAVVCTVVDADLKAGSYDGKYRWDGLDGQGRRVQSGTYFYRLETGSGHVQTRKMTLLK